jgi:hypothetical protein
MNYSPPHIGRSIARSNLASVRVKAKRRGKESIGNRLPRNKGGVPPSVGCAVVEEVRSLRTARRAAQTKVPEAGGKAQKDW